MIKWSELQETCKPPVQTPGYEPICDWVNKSKPWPAPSDLPVAQTGHSGPSAALAQATTSVAPSVSPGINQSAILWGTTDFMIQRATEEAGLAFVDHFVRSVCTEGSTPFFGEPGVFGGVDLFPRTCELLIQGFVNSDVRVGAIWPSLRLAARDDLYFFPYRALAGIANRQSGHAQDSLALSALAAYVAANILEGNNPARALAYGKDAAAIRFDDSPAALAAFKLTVWANTIDLLGPKDDTKADDVRAKLAAFAINWNALSQARVQLCRNAGEADQDCKVYVLPSIADPIDPQGNITEASFVGIQEGKDKLREIQANLDKVARGHQSKAVALQALTGTVADTLDVVIKVVDAIQGSASDVNADPTLQAVRQLFDELAAADFSRAVISGVAFINENNWIPYRSSTRLLSFLADVMVAADSSAVEKALANVAAPPDSYRTKRRRPFYLMINGYVGVGVSSETTQPSASSPVSAPSLSQLWNGPTSRAAGVTLPIGIEFGVGCWTRYLGCGTSLGVFLQAVDLGALATYRLSASAANATQPDPNVGFRQVLAPGAFLALGLPRLPISLLGGVDYVPSLRNVSTGQSVEPLSVYRASIRLAFDVPLFP